ncbi:hypothetical protein SUGI_0807920 [Cryptomeria japonica]|uniref:E3 ubiquitin-protein ligase ATL9 n=1 Tax=Cryptomeria japonica TaxID=3369 RepID=UPI0024148589|nr:E3 ubiquitin-protein ligase ATL9 [Cryptomeria japonica]GLJ39537.1 hypothetical protein SUGI_0807920 [Cryptomeria japonica]
MFLGKMHNFAADDGNTFFLSDRTSAPTLSGLSLADTPPDGNYNAPNYKLNVSFQASLIVVILGLVIFLLFIAFLILLICRRATFGEPTTSFRREETNNNERGLDQTVIESFPVFSYDLVKGLKARAMGSECAVCLSDFTGEEMVRLLPKCSHAFHPECIDMWLCSHSTCPVCRISLVPAEDSTPTANAEPRTTPEQVAIVVDNGNAEAIVVDNDNHDSTGHSLVRVRTELEQGTEWYISTPTGLKPGLRKSLSFLGHLRSQKPISSNAPPVCSKAVDSEEVAGHRSRSERWGGNSMNPATFIRSFSERVTPQPREQR